jgi:hypothetical protein
MSIQKSKLVKCFFNCGKKGCRDEEPEQFQYMMNKTVDVAEMSWVYICKECEQSNSELGNYIRCFIRLLGNLRDIPRLLWPKLQELNGTTIQHRRLLRNYLFISSNLPKGENPFDALCKFLGVTSADEIKVGNTYTVTHNRVSLWWYDYELHNQIEQNIIKINSNVVSLDRDSIFHIWIERYIEDDSLVLWENTYEKCKLSYKLTNMDLERGYVNKYERSTILKPDTATVRLLSISNFGT